MRCKDCYGRGCNYVHGADPQNPDRSEWVECATCEGTGVQPEPAKELCYFCQPGDKAGGVFANNEGAKLSFITDELDGPALLAFDEGGGAVRGLFPINYCPVCGRWLGDLNTTKSQYDDI